jgi:hypothetical protein
MPAAGSSGWSAADFDGRLKNADERDAVYLLMRFLGQITTCLGGPMDRPHPRLDIHTAAIFKLVTASPTR